MADVGVYCPRCGWLNAIESPLVECVACTTPFTVSQDA